MVEVTLEMDDQEIRFKVKGHAAHDVCGKVSILCQALTETLFLFRPYGPGYVVKNDEGFCEIMFRLFDIDQEYRSQVLSIFSLIDTGFLLLKEQFPGEIRYLIKDTA